MTWMVQAEFDGEKMTDDELKAFFVLLAVAANDTTRHASAHAIYAFLPAPRPARSAGGRCRPAGSTPRSRKRCAGGRRCCTCAAPPSRTVTLRGKEIKAGDKVVLWYHSANRDEDVFEDPFTFDIAASPTRT